MKKIICLVMLSLLVCGCDNKELGSNNLNRDSLKEIKESVESNKKIIEELNNKNKELESKIETLENEKEDLKKTISELKEKDKEVDKSILDKYTEVSKNIKDKYSEVSKSIADKYNELSKKISSSNSGTGSKYTVTKEQLLGKWDYVVGNSSITFTDENLLVHDNWIEWKGMAFPYLYKNGKLYISDDGVVLQK